MRSSYRRTPTPGWPGFTGLAGTAIANAQARVELRGYAEEQAALRRVATLVAPGRRRRRSSPRWPRRSGDWSAVRLRWHEPVRRRWQGNDRRPVEQHPRAHRGRRPAGAKRAERHHPGVPDGPARTDRRHPRGIGPAGRGRPSLGAPGWPPACRSAWPAGCGVQYRGIGAQRSAAGRHRGAAGRVH